MRCVSLRYESETVVFTHSTVECNNKQGGEHVACIEDGVFANKYTLAYIYFSLCLHAKGKIYVIKYTNGMKYLLIESWTWLFCEWQKITEDENREMDIM